MSERLTQTMFAKYLRTKFRLHSGTDQLQEIELTEVREGRPVPGQEQLAIYSEGHPGDAVGQGTYTLEYDRMTRFELFLIPIREDADGRTYEAVFNRFIQSD